MRALLLLLPFSVLNYTASSQCTDTLSNFCKVLASIEGKFQSLKGKEKPWHDRADVHYSKVQIEETDSNEVTIWPGGDVVYTAVLGRGLFLDNATLLLEKWNAVIKTMLPKKFKEQSQKIPAQARERNTGYRYFYEQRKEILMVDVYHFQMQNEGYKVVLLFTNTHHL